MPGIELHAEIGGAARIPQGDAVPVGQGRQERSCDGLTPPWRPPRYIGSA